MFCLPSFSRRPNAGRCVIKRRVKSRIEGALGQPGLSHLQGMVPGWRWEPEGIFTRIRLPGQLIQTHHAHRRPVGILDLLPNGQQILSGGAALGPTAPAQAQSEAKLWDASTGEPKFGDFSSGISSRRIV